MPELTIRAICDGWTDPYLRKASLKIFVLLNLLYSTYQNSLSEDTLFFCINNLVCLRLKMSQKTGINHGKGQSFNR